MQRLDTTEIENLRQQLKEENLKRQRLQASILDLEETLHRESASSAPTASSVANEDEWKSRYEAQIQINNELEQQALSLREQLKQAREKAKVVPPPVPYPNLSEAEVKKLLRRLEREKADLQRQLRDLEWRLDNESKAYHKLEEEARNMRLELAQVSKAIDEISQGGHGSMSLQLGMPSQPHHTLVRGGKKGSKRAGRTTPSPGKGGSASAGLTSPKSPTSPASSSTSPISPLSPLSPLSSNSKSSTGPSSPQNPTDTATSGKSPRQTKS